MRGLLLHARTGYRCTSTFSLRVLQYSTLGESERVLFLSQFFSVIIQILTSGIPGGIPQFRILQEASKSFNMYELLVFRITMIIFIVTMNTLEVRNTHGLIVVQWFVTMNRTIH